MFQLNDQDLKRMEDNLKRIRSTALPYATRQTLNDMAFFARKEAQSSIQSSMTLRNKFTVSSVRVDRARGSNISTQNAVTGSIAPYMDEQEFGGVKNRKRGRTVAIPTPASAGQSGRRTRLPRAAYKLGAIALRSGGIRRAANRKRRNAIAIATSLGGFAYLDLGRRKGIFRIAKDGKPTMLHDLTRSQVRIPVNKWLLPASQSAASKRGDFYRRALDYQLRRFAGSL